MALCRNGHPNPDGSTYCGECHVYIDEAATPPPAPAPAPAEPPLVTFSHADLRVSAGGRVSAEIRVVNPADAEDEYILDVQGAAAEWASVEPWRLSLPPSGDGTAELTFRPVSSVPQGTSVPFELVVTSRRLPGEPVALLGNVEIEPHAAPQPQPPTYTRYRSRRARGLGTSLFLIVVGAILLLADPSLDQTFADVERAGQVLLLVGAVGLVASLVAVFSGPARH